MGEPFTEPSTFASASANSSRRTSAIGRSVGPAEMRSNSRTYPVPGRPVRHHAKLAEDELELNCQQDFVVSTLFCVLRSARCGSITLEVSAIGVSCMSVDRSSVLSFRTTTNASFMERLRPEFPSVTESPSKRPSCNATLARNVPDWISGVWQVTDGGIATRRSRQQADRIIGKVPFTLQTIKRNI